MNKKVFLYDLEGNLLKEFKTTQELADYLDYPREYIYFNLKYYDKIRFKGKWFRIRREKIWEIGFIYF